MTKFKKIIVENKVFLIPYFIVAVAAIIFILSIGKANIHIFLNQFHSLFFDIFFKYFTYIGDGIIAISISILLLFINYRWAIISATSSILILIIIRFLKTVIFSDWFRPIMYFDYIYKGDYKLHLIEGVDLAGKYSFPSGHSTTAFATFFLLAIIVKSKALKFIFFLIASLAAFSRIYLSWHFLEDTIAGSFIGISITLATFLLISKSKKNWLNNSLIKNKK